MSITTSGIRRATLLLVLLSLVILTLPMFRSFLTNALLFHPTAGQDATPSDIGLSYEEHWFTSEDGTRTQGWWIPQQTQDAERLNITVLLFHGNAGTISHRLEFHRQLHRLGVSLMAVEYRGYGDSEGRPTEDGLAMDARAAYSATRELANARGDRLIVHGRSLGGAVAIRLAAERPVDGLIAESTFTSLKEMAGRTGIPFAKHLVAYEFPSIDRIRDVRAPVFLIHGDADELIPISMGQRLHQAVNHGEPAPEWFAVPNGTHNDTWLRAGEAYLQRIEAWLRTVTVEGSATSARRSGS